MAGISPSRARTAIRYAPFNWRGFFDFGCGSLGDMACHISGRSNMALRLGSPTSVECLKQEGKSQLFPRSRPCGLIFPPAATCRQ